MSPVRAADPSGSAPAWILLASLTPGGADATAASALLADGDDLSHRVVEDLALAPLADRFLINHVRLDPTYTPVKTSITALYHYVGLYFGAP